MKKTLSFILICILLFLCVPQSVLAADVADNNIYFIDDAFESMFLSDSFRYDGMEIQNVSNNYLQLSVNDSDSYISFDTFPEIDGLLSNKIRIVLNNQSECKLLNLEIKYEINGIEHVSEEEIEIETRSGEKTYYLDFEYASSITEVKVSFSRVSTGNIMLYSLLREYVYEDENDYIYKENTRVDATFDADTYTVSVVGTIGHGTVTKYSGAQIELHRLNIEDDVSSVLTDASSCIDSKPISIQFYFSVKANSISEVYSQYVLVVKSHTGEKELLTTPIVAGNEEKKASYIEHNDIFKGVSSELTVDVIDVNPSLVIVDVFLDRLENPNGSGHYFSMDQSSYYFDREYMNELDKKIKAYTDTSCELYLRFRLDSTGENDLYKTVSSDFWKDIYVYSYYLAQRYNGGEYGGFSGIIVGQEADRFPVSTNSDVQDYLKFYSMFLYIVSESVRGVDRDVRIFVPISDVAYSKTTDTSGYESELFLLSLSEIMSRLYSDPCSFSVALCSGQTPLGVSDQDTDSDTVYYTSEKIKDFERMLTCVAGESSLVSRDYIFVWSPPTDLSGSMLTASYAYNYLKLFFGSYAESFVVDFDRSDKLSDLKHVIKYIDTSSFSDAVGPALDIIGAESWQELIINFNKNSIEKVKLSETTPVDISATNFRGSYDIWKFSELNGIGGWYSLNGCNSVSINVSSDFGRCLVAKIQPHNKISGEYSSIMYAFEEPKDISFADYITYSLGIACENDANAVFEFKFVIGSENEIIEATQVVKAGELNDIAVDVKELGEISYMQINIKPISNQDASYNLYVSKVSELSKKYTSDELKELEEYKEEEEDDAENPFSDVPITTTMIISFSVIFLIIIFVFAFVFKKIDKNN